MTAAPCAMAQQWEATPPPAERIAPYLGGDLALIVQLSPPPDVGSPEDAADMSAVGALAHVGAARREEAERDALYVYPEFERDFGLPLNRVATPRTITLLNRALTEVSRAVFQAKTQFPRPRPYQREQLTRICGLATAPAPDPQAIDRMSYPSGHAAFGWMAGALLSRLSPERASRLMDRASVYGLSRVVCGMHFPSDVVAGEALAEAVLAELEATRAFQRDLQRARAEIGVLREGR